MREKLENDIHDYKVKLEKLTKIKEVTSKFDGKVFGKKFVTLLETIPNINVRLSARKALFTGKPTTTRNYTLAVWVENQVYDLMYVDKCELEFLTDDNRFDFNRFSVFVDERIAEFETEKRKIERDLEDGDQRLQKWNSLVMELLELKDSFSEKYIEYRHMEFEPISRP